MHVENVTRIIKTQFKTSFISYQAIDVMYESFSDFIIQKWQFLNSFYFDTNDADDLRSGIIYSYRSNIR